MRVSRTLPSSFIVLATLAACGDTVPEQALFGAGAGAGTAAIVGGSLLTGAAVGAAGNIAFCQISPEKC